jgi:serine/threonine protein kinase
MNAPLALDPADWQCLRRLLDQALALPTAQRPAWLAALPAGQQHLHPHLVRLLAQADDRTHTGRFEALPILPEAEIHPGAPPLPPDIGPYRPLRLLGEGGMSSVWLAERTDVLLNRPVALKLPRTLWRHAGLAQRMAQEREILATLDHPHIARIYDAGVAADGQPYLALAYIDGQPIDAHCRDQALELRQTVQLFLQVTSAVAHAHARLVVHRDLKPSNILVSTDGQAHLLDFGIAKLLDDSLGTAAGLTHTHERVMTPHYAAPEQLLGQAIGTATDVYALGAVLYELLTGLRPCRPARQTAAALEEAILHAEPPPPSQACGEARRARGLRGDLDTIVLKALKKRPEERYASAEALADDLQNWLDHRPVKAQPDSSAYRARKYLLRHRLALGVTALVMLSLLAGLAAALWQADLARREAAKATAIKNYLLGLFQTNDIEQRDGLKLRQQSVQQLLEHSVATLAQGLGDQPEVRDELQRVVGGLLDDLALKEAASQVRQQRSAQLEAQAAPLALRVQALREWAGSELSRGEVAAARGTMGRALQLCEAAERGARLECLQTQVEFSRLDFAERHIDAALARVAPATQALRALAPDSLALATALDLHGMLRLEQNQGDEAYALLQESIAIKRLLWGSQSVHLAIARFRLARNLWNLRYLAQAEAELRGAWDIVREALGPAHRLSARIELNLGRLTAYLGVHGDGLAHVRHAADSLARQAASLDPHDRLEAHTVQGNVLLVEGRLDEAGPALRQALALREPLPVADWVDPTLDQSWARYLMDSGRYAEARDWLLRFRERTVRTYGEQHPNTADRSLRLAWLELAEGRLEAAQREIDGVLRSQDAREAVFGSVKHRAQQAQVALLLAQGRAAEAAALAEAHLALAARQPREALYRDVLVLACELAARAAAQQGQWARARSLFERSLALMAVADPAHPYAAALRARYAQVLHAQGDDTTAKAQLDQAERALRAHATLGDQFKRPLREARLAMGRSP